MRPEYLAAAAEAWYLFGSGHVPAAYAVSPGADALSLAQVGVIASSSPLRRCLLLDGHERSCMCSAPSCAGRTPIRMNTPPIWRRRSQPAPTLSVWTALPSSCVCRRMPSRTEYARPPAATQCSTATEPLKGLVPGLPDRCFAPLKLHGWLGPGGLDMAVQSSRRFGKDRIGKPHAATWLPASWFFYYEQAMLFTSIMRLCTPCAKTHIRAAMLA